MLSICPCIVSQLSSNLDCGKAGLAWWSVSKPPPSSAVLHAFPLESATRRRGKRQCVKVRPISPLGPCLYRSGELLGRLLALDSGREETGRQDRYFRSNCKCSCQKRGLSWVRWVARLLDFLLEMPDSQEMMTNVLEYPSWLYCRNLLKALSGDSEISRRILCCENICWHRSILYENSIIILPRGSPILPSLFALYTFNYNLTSCITGRGAASEGIA